MININPRSGIPLYEQIVDEVKYLLIKGVLREGDQLPTVRQLSSKLAINPNTIQKAYQELESLGFIYSMRGRGNFVGSVNDIKSNYDLKELREKFERQLEELIFLGLTKDEFIQLFDNIASKKGGPVL